MKYIVIGVGLYGESLATRLVELGAEVIVVDKNEQTVAAIQDMVTEAVVADCSDKEALKEVINRYKPDGAAVGFGENFDASMLVCIYLRELGITEIVARASSEIQAEILRRMGINWIILPEQIMGERIGEYIMLGESEQIKLDSETSIVRLKLPINIHGKVLSELSLKKHGITPLFVHRVYIQPDLSKLIPPSENPELEEDDNLILIGSPRRIAKFISHLKKE